MFCSRFVISALLSLLAFQVLASDAPTTVANQVNLSVVRYDDHFLVECSPKDDNTASRNDWKIVCNEMAAPQIAKLVAEGTVAPVAGAVFDLTSDLVSSSTGQALSKNIPLSQ